MGPLNRRRRARPDSATWLTRFGSRTRGRVLDRGDRAGHTGIRRRPLSTRRPSSSDVAPESALLTEEVFGPVLPVARFPTSTRRFGSRTTAGLASGHRSGPAIPGTIREVTGRLQAGIVWVNLHLKVPPEVPFGGVKESGLGRENGIQALEAWSETKSVLVRTHKYSIS